MKLKNKLLPLVGVATACAAVAPIALTSCKSNNDGEWVDLMTKYTPSVKALDNQTATTTEANKLYFGDEKDGWKSDEDVIAQFKDDYCWYYSTRLNSGYYSNYDSVKIKFDDFYVAHQTYTPATGDPYKIPVFSFKMEYERTYTYQNSSTETRTTTEKSTMTLVNVPFSVAYLNDSFLGDYAFRVCPDGQIISANESSKAPIAWAATTIGETTTTYTDTEEGIEMTTTDTFEQYMYQGGDNFGELIYAFQVQPTSHYLFSVQHAY